MSIEAVIFDIGGVLEESPPTGWRERWARRLRMDGESLERCLDEVWAGGSIGAARLHEIERRAGAALGLDQAGLAEFMDDAWTEYLGTLNQELADYFVSLRPTYKTGILSNSFVGAREREQDAYGLGDMCDLIVLSHEEGCQKPDPRIYRVVCDRLGVAPQVTVFLDDVPENIEGAQAVGITGVLFASNRQAIAELEALLNA